MVNVAGTAADLAGVANVTVQIGTNDFVPANGTTNWSATVTLTPGTNIFPAKATDLSGNTVTNSKGNLVTSFTNTVGLAASGKVTNASPNNLTLTVIQPTGQFNGSATPPSVTKAIPFKGAVLQKQGYGGGYFLGTNLTGHVVFGP